MKKQTAIIAVIVMILNMLQALPAAAASEEVSSRRSEAIAVVNGLGLADKSGISDNAAESYITRAEFAGMAAALTGNVRGNLTPSFFDVQSDNAFADEIYTLSNMGVMVGFSDIEFGPNENMTAEQGTIVLLRMLGYSPLIEKGLWDAQTAVQRTDLYNGVRSALSDKLTKGDAAVMVYNALTAPMCIRDYNANGGYSVDNTRCIMYDNLKISVTHGIVNQSYFSSLTTGMVPISETQVAIDNEVFECGGYTDAKNYFGYNVECYYRENPYGGYEAVYMLPKKTKSVTVQSEDFEDLNGRTFKYTVKNINYTTSIKTETLQLADALDVVYNGVVCPDYTDDDLLLKDRAGYSTFIDNNNDGKYEVVLITECRDYVVSYVNDKTKTVYTKWQGNIDLSAVENIYIYDLRGQRIEFGIIKSGDILTMQMSKDGKNVTIIRTVQVVETAVKSINYAKRTVVLADNREYTVDESLWQKIDDIKINTYGMFYFDYRGRIAGLLFENYGTNEGYAFLSRIWQEKGDDTVYVKLFRMSGEMEQYKLKKTLTVDGSKVKATAFCDKMILTDTDGTKYTDRKVVKFKANDAGDEVYFIDTPDLAEGESEESLYVKGYRNTGGGESYAEGYFRHFVYMAQFRQAMMVPMPAADEMKSAVNNYADDDYYIRPFKDNMTFQNFDAFPITDSGAASMMVNYYTKRLGEVQNYGGDYEYDSLKGRASVMVNDIATVWDEETSQVVQELEYYENNVKKTAIARDEKILKKPVYNDDGTVVTGQYKDLVRGDVVRLYIEHDGSIGGIWVDLDSERKDNRMFSTTDITVQYATECGVVYSAGESSIRLLATPVASGVFKPSEMLTDIWVTRMYNSTMVCTMYNRADDEVKEASYSDILGYKQDPENPAIVFARCAGVGYSNMFVIR